MSMVSVCGPKFSLMLHDESEYTASGVPSVDVSIDVESTVKLLGTSLRC